MSNKVTNIAVIGCGYWGPNLVRNFYQLPNAHVSYVCDLDEARLVYMRSIYPGVKTSTDYSEVIRAKDVDAVCVATPVASHFKIASEALKAGRHVLIEKPMTSTSSEARSLIELSRSRKKTLMVAHTFQYNAAIDMLRELIQKKELGSLLYVSMSRLNLGVFRNDTNVVWDLSSHDISVLNDLLGRKPDRVKVFGSAHYHKGIEDVAFLNLHYPKNLLAHIHVSWIDPLKVRRVVFVGDKKMAVFDDLNDAEPLKIYDKRVVKQPYYDTYGEFKLLYNWGDIHVPKINTVEPLKAECSHFLECIQKRKRPLSDGRAGLHVVEVLEAAQRSLRLDGRPVRVA